MSDQDIKDLLKPLNQELVSIQLTQIPNLRAELQDNVRSLVLRLDAHGKAIAEGKSADLNITTLLQTQEKLLLELDKRLKKLETPIFTLPKVTSEGIKFTPEQRPKLLRRIFSGK